MDALIVLAYVIVGLAVLYGAVRFALKGLLWWGKR